MKSSQVCVVRILLIFAFAISLTGCAKTFDRSINVVSIDPPYTFKPETSKLHNRLTIIDLHADPLLWKRDLLERNSYGHVDLPRLQDGNMALQVFGVVTGVPFPLKMEGNQDRKDLITLLSKWGGWPENTQHSRLQRALYQAEKLNKAIADSSGQLMLIESRDDLEKLLTFRARGRSVVGGMLSLEGAHGLDGDVANLDILFNAGFRMLGLVHLMDNDMGSSVHGVGKYGLTEKGRLLIEKALELGMIIDLAHATPKTIDDVIGMVDRPVIASHGGVRATCDTARNLADEDIKAIAGTGGVVGIGLYEYATCGETMADTVKAIRHVVDLVGVEFVALGSDFDGATETVVDATGLPLLTEALLEEGFSREEIGDIMGGNVTRVFRKTLPGNNDI